MNERLSIQSHLLAASLKRGLRHSLYCLLAMSTVAFSLPVGATTPKPMTLAEVKQTSGSIVLGKVTNLQVKFSDSSLKPDHGEHKSSFAPATEDMNRTGEAHPVAEEDHALTDSGHHRSCIRHPLRRTRLMNPGPWQLQQQGQTDEGQAMARLHARPAMEHTPHHSLPPRLEAKKLSA